MTRLIIATSDRSAGGIQRALADQLRLLSANEDYEITVLSPLSDFHKTASSGQHHIITLSQIRRLAYRYLPPLARFFEGHRGFDIALCHNGFMAAGLKGLARHVIGICHNDKPYHFTSCDHLVCLTKNGIDKAAASGWDKSRLHLISHFHEASDTPPAKHAYRVKDTRKNTEDKQTLLTIGAAGRMVAKKNLSLFIDIAALVKKTHPDITFQLGGTGPQEAEISAYNKAKGQPVSLLGWTDFENFLEEIDILVVPSKDEPFGYVFPEAMAQGVGILASPTFGAHHCLANGTIAPIIAADRPQDFADAICRLADDHKALYQLQSACYAAARDPIFHRQTAQDSWQKLIRQLTA